MSSYEVRKELWNSMAEDTESTHPDPFQAKLELQFMLNFVSGRVLNAGCGAGYETIQCHKHTGFAVGVDFSEKMISFAKKHEHGNCSFRLQNILDLQPIRDEYGKFDTITTRRTLINLLSWDDQKKAIIELKECLTVGGRLILIEGLKEGYVNLNKLRHEVGLEDIPIVDYNLSLSSKKLDKFMKNNDLLWAVEGDISLYYYLTRVFYPTLNEPEYDSRFAESAFELQNKHLFPLFNSPILMKVYEERK